MSGASAEDLIGRYQSQSQFETEIVEQYGARDSWWPSATYTAALTAILSHMAVY